MTDEGKPIQPEHVLKRVVWRGTISIGATLEKSTTWTITGVAAIIGLFISNLDSASKIIAVSGIRWSLILFASSLLAGAISKQIGMAVQSGVQVMAELEGLLNSEPGRQLMKAMTVEPHQLMREVAQPFLWPLSLFVRRGGERGIRDYLSGDKRLVRMLCLQIYLNALHTLLTVVAVIVLAVSIKIT